MARKEIRLGRASPDPAGDPDGMVDHPDALVCHASLVILTKNSADLLERQYPGWGWALNPDEAGGVLNIRSLRLSGSHGYTLKLGEIQNDPQLREVIRAGGELLERFGYRAAPFRLDQYLAGPRHFGRPIADTSDMASKRRRDYRTHNLQRAIDDGRARIIMDADIARAKAARPL